MSQTRKSRSVQATEDSKQKLRQAKAAKRNNHGKPWTFANIATAAGRDEKTVKSFFYGKRDETDSALAITQVLGVPLADVVDINQDQPPTAHLEPEQTPLIHRVLST